MPLHRLRITIKVPKNLIINTKTKKRKSKHGTAEEKEELREKILLVLNDFCNNGDKFCNRIDVFHKMSTVIDSKSSEHLQSVCCNAKTRTDAGKASDKDKVMWDLIERKLVERNYDTSSMIGFDEVLCKIALESIDSNSVLEKRKLHGEEYAPVMKQNIGLESNANLLFSLMKELQISTDKVRKCKRLIKLQIFYHLNENHILWRFNQAILAYKMHYLYLYILVWNHGEETLFRYNQTMQYRKFHTNFWRVSFD